jgi:hypothetical protein
VQTQSAHNKARGWLNFLFATRDTDPRVYPALLSFLFVFPTASSAAGDILSFHTYLISSVASVVVSNTVNAVRDWSRVKRETPI